MTLRLLILCILAFSAYASSSGGSADSKTRLGRGGFNPTKKSLGAPWPKPEVYITSDNPNLIIPQQFQFIPKSFNCDILQNYFDRTYKNIFQPARAVVIKPRKKPSRPNLHAGMTITSLDVYLQGPCDNYPTLESSEQYSIEVSDGVAALVGYSIWGALRGLETFSQMVYQYNGQFYVNDTRIDDAPRFAHRGLLLDTSRHFIRKEILLMNLDAMAANKMNVFHWHIVDDQSFPYQSLLFPQLSEQGAYDPYTHVYSRADMKEIIEYARNLGIRVVPEFDSPGHTESWGFGQSGLLTPCYSGSQPNGDYGPVDPTVNTSYTFLKAFFQETVNLFPDKYVHLGGDEVDFSCWASNPFIKTFMTKMGFGTDYSKLEQYYMQILLDIVGSFPTQNGYIIWQEVIDNGVTVKPDTVVEVWKDPHPDEMSKVTALGLRALLSTCWYLNYISYGDDWHAYYQCEPLAFNGTAQQKALVMGGEACMWGEYVDGTNVIQRTWPRTGAVAERLWSPVTQTDINEASPRLEEQRCRMIRRGITAEPISGSGYCDEEI